MGKVQTLLMVVSILILVALTSVAINVLLIKNNVINMKKIYLGGEKVKISEEAKQQLDDIYLNNLEYETVTCLAGEINGDGITVDYVKPAKMITSNKTSATYVQCPYYLDSYKSIGTLHNHPGTECRLSTQDIETYASDVNDGMSIMGIYCEKYVFYILMLIEGEVV